jgi:hypothetical protein
MVLKGANYMLVKQGAPRDNFAVLLTPLEEIQLHLSGLNLHRLSLARLEGLEPSTLGLEGRCSIQLSYRRSNHTKSWSG